MGIKALGSTVAESEKIRDLKIDVTKWGSTQ